MWDAEGWYCVECGDWGQDGEDGPCGLALCPFRTGDEPDPDDDRADDPWQWTDTAGATRLMEDIHLPGEDTT
jgi:hypothetical protein